MKIVYLKQKSSFKNNLRSDTLWGLICWGIKTIYSEENLESFLGGYSEGRVVKLSSAFPYKNSIDKDKIRFYPKPISKPLNFNEYFESRGLKKKEEKAKSIAFMKKFKKTRYLDENTFKLFLAGELNEEALFEIFSGGKTIESLPEIETSDVLHNTINRLTNTTTTGAGSLFTTTEMFIKDGGLYFLLDGPDAEVSLVEGALRFLEHFGFGGDSSIGKGHFDVEIKEFNTFDSLNKSDTFVSLSLYNPSNIELEFFKENPENTWYELETRKGKYGGHFEKPTKFWKKSLLMFKEGSVFPQHNDSPGQLVSVKDKESDVNHPIYQFGYAFNLPIKLK
ncbi:MAG: hypothetical protein SCALA702_32440 [Melioribacteraceae bacterium]|nr:MAG: hypothetical protein SCALA702_32440 [Melioribacteraceae bacterium]